MKIAFVTGWGVKPENGGQGTFCAELVASLASRGHTLALLSRDLVSWERWAARAGLAEKIRIRPPSPAELARADVVHLNGPAVRALAWTSVLRRPTVVTHEDYHLCCPIGIAWHTAGCRVSVDQPELCARCSGGSPLSRLHLHVQELLSRGTRGVAVSEYVRQRLGLSEVVLHPFDASAWPDLSHAPVERRVACIGRLVPEKGPQIAVAALPHLPGVTLDVYGDGELRSDLETQARALGVADRVHLLGIQPSPIARAASAAAILVPGLWHEPLGYVTIEAMAAGKAVIASALGGSLELLSSDRGWLVPPNDPKALAVAIDQVLNDAGERVRRGTRARAFIAATLDPACVGERYEAIYERAIGSQVRRVASAAV